MNKCMDITTRQSVWCRCMVCDCFINKALYSKQKRRLAKRQLYCSLLVPNKINNKTWEVAMGGQLARMTHQIRMAIECLVNWKRKGIRIFQVAESENIKARLWENNSLLKGNKMKGHWTKSKALWKKNYSEYKGYACHLAINTRMILKRARQMDREVQEQSKNRGNI